MEALPYLPTYQYESTSNKSVNNQSSGVRTSAITPRLASLTTKKPIKLALSSNTETLSKIVLIKDSELKRAQQQIMALNRELNEKEYSPEKQGVVANLKDQVRQEKRQNGLFAHRINLLETEIDRYKELLQSDKIYKALKTAEQENIKLKEEITVLKADFERQLKMKSDQIEVSSFNLGFYERRPILVTLEDVTKASKLLADPFLSQKLKNMFEPKAFELLQKKYDDILEELETEIKTLKTVSVFSQSELISKLRENSDEINGLEMKNKAYFTKIKDLEEKINNYRLAENSLKKQLYEANETAAKLSMRLSSLNNDGTGFVSC